MLNIYSLVVLAMFSFQPSGRAYQSPEPRTVLDYYLLLPGKYFEAEKEQRVKWMLDPGRGAIVDVKNGYIYAPGDGAQMSLHVCLFKKADGSSVIAVKSKMEGETYLDFYAYRQGRFIDITRSVLPVAVNEELEYEMPRYGTTIKVKNRRGRSLYDLTWTGDRFSRKRG